MRFPPKDMIATGLVAVAGCVYVLWAIGSTLPGLSGTRASGIVILVLGFPASANAVVPGFDQFFRGNKTYLAVTTILGVVALIVGVAMLVAASDTGLGVVMAAMLVLWLIATIRHIVLPQSTAPTDMHTSNTGLRSATEPQQTHAPRTIDLIARGAYRSGRRCSDAKCPGVRRRRNPMRKALVFFTLLTCLALVPLTVGHAGAATSSTTRPFIVFAKGTVTPGTSDVTGSFLATQLGFGHFTEASSLIAVNWPIVVFGTHVVLTAVDGETVVVDGAIVEFPSVTPTCHGFSIAGGATITGGTGRFAHATGQVQTTGCNDSSVTPPAITVFEKGQITF